MDNLDVRWKQRFSNYRKALKKLTDAVEYLLSPVNNQEQVVVEMLREGLIQRFEYTHELAWNVMKDYIHYQGNADIKGSRDATREAFKIGLIKNGKVWMAMIPDRNRTTHTYNSDTVDEIFDNILGEYYDEFVDFERVMEGLRGEQTTII